jgi:hypothetical protein
MRGRVGVAAGLVLASAATILIVSNLAGAAGPSAPVIVATPLWEVHVRDYPGGISNGVRAAANVPEASVGAPKAGAHAPTNTSPSARSGNIQMDDNSYPPLPQNETAVAFNTSNEQIAVAAS